MNFIVTLLIFNSFTLIRINYVEEFVEPKAVNAFINHDTLKRVIRIIRLILEKNHAILAVTVFQIGRLYHFLKLETVKQTEINPKLD